MDRHQSAVGYIRVQLT